jgi:hypothetical protein
MDIMFVQLFRRNHPSVIFFIVLYGFSIGALSIFQPQEVIKSEESLLYYNIENLLIGNLIVNKLLAFLLIIGEALLLNFIINQNEVLSKKTFLPAIFYITFASIIPQFHTVSPILFAQLFLLIGIQRIIGSYRKDKALGAMFDFGLCFSIATLFYFPAFLFLLLLPIGLFLFRPFVWREWITGFAGILLPYLFLIAYLFWNNSLSTFFKQEMFEPKTFRLDIYDYTSSNLILIVIIIFLFVFSLYSFLNSGSRISQRSKKSTAFLVWMFLLSIASLFFLNNSQLSSYNLLLGLIPVSLIFSSYFAHSQKMLWLELIFIVLIGSMIMNTFN